MEFQNIELNKGQILFREGQPGKSAYLVRRGVILVHKEIGGKQVELNRLVPGQILGEMAVITGEVRSATAEALELSELLEIDEKALQFALKKSTPIIKALMEQLIYRFRNKEKLVDDSIRIGSPTQKIENMQKTINHINAAVTEWLEKNPLGDPALASFLETIRTACRLEQI